MPKSCNLPLVFEMLPISDCFFGDCYNFTWNLAEIGSTLTLMAVWKSCIQRTYDKQPVGLGVFPRFFDKSISFLGAVVLHMVNFLLQAMTMSDVRPRLTHCFFHFLSIHVDKLRIVCTNTAPYIIIHTVIIYYI